MIAFLALFMLAFPLFLIWKEKSIKLIGWISPIIICYATGVILANLPFLNLDKEIATTLSEVTVPLAIPLLLFSTSIIKWLKGAKKAVISFFLCVVAVAISATVAVFIFEDQFSEAWKMGGMVMGVYTGGTPNMSAVGLSLEVEEETFILLNAADLVWGALYLLFLMTLAKPILGRFLPKYESTNSDEEENEKATFKTLANKQKAKNLSVFLGLALAILGASIGLSILLNGSMEAITIILTVTTLGVVLSFVKKVNTLPGSYELGEYFLLVFCLALGSLADVSELISSASQTLYFMGFVITGAISLHYLMAYFAKIDRDTVIITSVAALYGPAFVGPIAKVLDNKAIILTGMTTGLVGYALGNYLGIGFALLLKNWF